MKTLHFLRANILLLAALLIAGVVMSFSRSQNNSDKAATVYYYVSEDMNPGDFANPAHWSTSNEDGVACGSEEIRPCKVHVPAGSSLAAVLSGKTNRQVLDISDGFKPNP